MSGAAPGERPDPVLLLSKTTVRLCVFGIIWSLMLITWYECFLLRMQSPAHPFAIAAFLGSLFISFTYWKACVVPAGFPDPAIWSGGDEEVEITGPPASYLRIKRKNINKSKKWYQKGGHPYCNECKVVKPPRTHHCSMCNKCVLRMDHHCKWTGNCQGQYNYKYFFLFLMSVSLTTTLGIFVHIYGFWYLEYPATPWDMCLTYTAAVQCVTVLIAVGQLWIYHIQRVLTNSTTLEDETTFYNILDPDPKRYPYNRGSWKANVSVFLGPNPLLWFVPVNNVSLESGPEAELDNGQVV